MIHGNKHLQSTLVESAWGATRKKDSYLKRKYQKLIIRKGGKKAVVAIAHKIIIAAYHVLKNKEAYKEPLLQEKKAIEKKKQKEIQKHILQLSSLGFTVRLTLVQ